MRSIRITKNADGTYGLKMVNGKFVWAEDGTQAAQHATTRLNIFYGENELNPELGTKWYQIIFQTNKSRAEKEFEIKRILLGTPGIKQVRTFNWSQSGHTASIDSIVDTDWGEIDLSQEITPL